MVFGLIFGKTKKRSTGKRKGCKKSMKRTNKKVSKKSMKRGNKKTSKKTMKRGRKQRGGEAFGFDLAKHVGGLPEVLKLSHDCK